MIVVRKSGYGINNNKGNPMTAMTRNELITNTLLRLGDQLVSVELDPEHLHLAVDRAFRRYRQRSENAVEESFVPLELAVDQNMYTLDEDIIDIKDILGRVAGSTGTGVGNQIEPFEAQYLNTYLLQGGRTGGLAIYDALAQQHELLGLMFGAEYTFTWNRTKHILHIHRRPKSIRTVYLYCYKKRSEDDLLADHYALPWLEDYTLASAKLMLGEGRGKFATIAGPQGGTTLNGDQLKADAQQELLQLEDDIKLYKEGSAALGIIIG